MFLLGACYLKYYDRSRVNRDAPIASQYTRPFAKDGKIWKEVRELLVGMGAVTCDYSYTIGSKCYYHTLTAAWAGETWKLQGVFEDWPIIAGSLSSLPYLSIDTEEALGLLDRSYAMRSVKAKKVFRRTKRKGNYWDTSTWGEDERQIFEHYIQTFDNRFSVSKTGRLYTMANALPKELRHALRIHGERTEELDVKCCQPLLLVTLYPRQTLEKAKFQSLVEHGDVYAAARDTICGTMDRNEFKNNHFIPWLFGSKEGFNPYAPAIEAWFAIQFPELMAEIRRIGKVKNAKDETARNPKALPRHLQRLESKLIWKTVEAAGIPAVSIHDGVRVRVGDLEKARAVLMASFWDSYQLTPQIEVSDVLKNLRTFEEEKAA
ncbi:hypothetical protein llg_28560 [Luteolibacter sp. LG18]|nr:hypothetical protein llg_28560 [Luteolibacter sp. LG18]